MHALVRFSHIAAQNTFMTPEIYADTLGALEVSSKDYSLAALRYDLWKLRAKGLVEKVPHSRRYRLLRQGYSFCLSGVPETIRKHLCAADSRPTVGCLR